MPKKKEPGPLPETLADLIIYLSDPDRCIQYAATARWPDGIVCPRCGLIEAHIYIRTRRMWECKGCRKQFSVKVGTIFEESRLGMEKWFAGIWMLLNAKNGISSCELSRSLGVTQKTAWFMLQRIRMIVHNGTIEKKLSGIVEVDETYIGGKARNMHKDKKKLKIKGRGGTGKAIVQGLLERHGEVRTQVVGNIKKKTLQDQIEFHVEPGSEVHTDELKSYNGLSKEYVHNVVNHAETYVVGHVYTNGIENFWSLLKRSIEGTYTSCEAFHLFRYLDEQCFRFNNRKLDDAGRFEKAMTGVADKRLTYRQLIGEAQREGGKPRRGGRMKPRAAILYLNPEVPKKYSQMLIKAVRKLPGKACIFMDHPAGRQMLWYRTGDKEYLFNTQYKAWFTAQ